MAKAFLTEQTETNSDLMILEVPHFVIKKMKNKVDTLIAENIELKEHDDANNIFMSHQTKLIDNNNKQLKEQLRIAMDKLSKYEQKNSIQSENNKKKGRDILNDLGNYDDTDLRNKVKEKYKNELKIKMAELHKKQEIEVAEIKRYMNILTGYDSIKKNNNLIN